jgi:hypothetical protein
MANGDKSPACDVLKHHLDSNSLNSDLSSHAFCFADLSSAADNACQLAVDAHRRA